MGRGSHQTDYIGHLAEKERMWIGSDFLPAGARISETRHLDERQNIAQEMKEVPWHRRLLLKRPGKE